MVQMKVKDLLQSHRESGYTEPSCSPQGLLHDTRLWFCFLRWKWGGVRLEREREVLCFWEAFPHLQEKNVVQNCLLKQNCYFICLEQPPWNQSSSLLQFQHRLTDLAHVSLEAYAPWPGRMRSPNWPGLDSRGTINPMTKNDLKKKRVRVRKGALRKVRVPWPTTQGRQKAASVPKWGKELHGDHNHWMTAADVIAGFEKAGPPISLPLFHQSRNMGWQNG